MKLNLTAEEFTKMYMEKPNHIISEELGISLFVIRKYAKKLGLKKKLGRPFKEYDFSD